MSSLRPSHPLRSGRVAFVATLILLPGALLGVPVPAVSPPGSGPLMPNAVGAGGSAVPLGRDRGAERSRPGRAVRGGADRPAPRERDPLRALGDDPIGAVIEVAEDVSAEWGQELRALRDDDPTALRHSISTNGRRLVALAVLRDREPELYRLKVTELRIQAETVATLAAYREAVADDRQPLAAALLGDLRRHVQRQVDHDLRTRGEELRALDLQLQRMRDQLTEDAINRERRIAETLDLLLADGGDAETPWNTAADR